MRISRGTPEARSRLCVCQASFLMTFAMGGVPHAGPQQATPGQCWRHLHTGALIGWLLGGQICSPWKMMGYPGKALEQPCPLQSFSLASWRQRAGLRWGALHPLDAVTSHRVCLPRCTIVKMPPQPFQRQPGNNEHEEVDGSELS